jgi:hypothetical protein
MPSYYANLIFLIRILIKNDEYFEKKVRCYCCAINFIFDDQHNQQQHHQQQKTTQT